MLAAQRGSNWQPCPGRPSDWDESEYHIVRTCHYYHVVGSDAHLRYYGDHSTTVYIILTSPGCPTMIMMPVYCEILSLSSRCTGASVVDALALAAAVRVI
jgi:hypothetical protein